MYRSRSPSPTRQPRTPPSQSVRRSKHGVRQHDRGYSLPSNPRSQSPPRRRSEVVLQLCVFHVNSHNWATAPLRFKPHKTTDRELWYDIRDVYRFQLRKPWLRWLSFRHVTSIVPIAYSPNGAPMRTDPKDFPEARLLRHAFHHPETIKTQHYWVDYLTEFDAGDVRQNGLEFREGLWPQKLGALALLASTGIIVACIIWCALGGNLQTVFTVMGFVLSFVAAEIALIALYFQVVSNDQTST